MQKFEWKLSQCSNIDEVRQLIKRDPDINMNLVKESCSPPIKLISDVFERLSLHYQQRSYHYLRKHSVRPESR